MFILFYREASLTPVYSGDLTSHDFGDIYFNANGYNSEDQQWQHPGVFEISWVNGQEMFEMNRKTYRLLSYLCGVNWDFDEGSYVFRWFNHDVSDSLHYYSQDMSSKLVSLG